MPGSTTSTGRDALFAVVAETVFGDGGSTAYAAADDFVDCSGWAVTPQTPGGPRDDATGYTAHLGDIKGKKTVEWTLSPTYLKPNANGTDPDWHVLLTKNGFTGGSWSASDAVEAGSTTTVINATGHSYSVDDFVRINGEIRRVSATATDSFTITPALTATPSATDAISPCKAYSINEDRDTVPDSVALWLIDNNRTVRIRGAMATSLSITGSDPAGLKFGLQGQARRADIIPSAFLDGSINNVVTTVDLLPGHGIPSDVSATDLLYLQVGTEVLKVLSISSDSLTVDTRGVYLGGGAAASHSDGAEVYVYHYTPSTAGNIVDSTAGDAIIAGSPVKSVTACSATIELGVEPWANEHGDAYEVHGYNVNKVEPTIAMDALVRRGEALDLMARAQNRTATEVLWQQGTASGGAVALYMQAAYLEVPAQSIDAGEATATLSLSFAGVMAAAGDSPIFLVVS